MIMPCATQELMHTPNKLPNQALVCQDPKSTCLPNFTSPLGLYFWDYGNSFLLEARRAGADVGVRGGSNESASSSIDFRYPSYVQDIMG